MSYILDISDEMRELYIQHRKKDLHRCLTALKMSDFSFLEKIGHQVKGNALSFGFDDLTSVAIELEGAAKAHDIQHLEKVLSEFDKAIQKFSDC